MSMMSEFDWNREAMLRECLMFVIVIVLVLVMALRMWWLPQQVRIKKFKVDRAAVGLQIDALTRLIDAAKRQMYLRADGGKAEGKTEEKRRLHNIVETLSSSPAEEVARVTHILAGRRMVGGLVFRGVEVRPSKTGESLVTIPLAVSIEGTFNNLQRYLRNIRNADLPLVVHGMQLKREEGKPGIVSGELLLHLFAHQAGAAVGAVPKAGSAAAEPVPGKVPQAKH